MVFVFNGTRLVSFPLPRQRSRGEKRRNGFKGPDKIKTTQCRASLSLIQPTTSYPPRMPVTIHRHPPTYLLFAMSVAPEARSGRDGGL